MVRFARRDDASEISYIQYENIKNTYREIYTNKFFESMDINEYISKTVKYIENKRFRTVVKEENGYILGFACIDLYIKDNVSMLDYLHVRHGYQNQGIGTELFYEMCLLASSLGIERMEISCVEGNDKAKKFYEKLGAQYIGSYIYSESGKPCFSNRYCVKTTLTGENKGSLYLDLVEDFDRLVKIIKKEYCLWGVGEYYNHFFEHISPMRLPVAILDNDPQKQGLSVNGVKIIAPKNMDIPIIVTSKFYNEIEKELINLGNREFVFYYPWHEYIIED